MNVSNIKIDQHESTANPATTQQERIAFAQRYLENLSRVLLETPVEELAQALEIFEQALVKRNQVFVVGNGGSASTASHMVNDFMKGVAKDGGRGLRVICLSDSVAVITAIANDQEYTEIFSGQLAELAQADDVLVVFSGSGNSPNIVRAAIEARKLKMTTVAFLGMGGGRVAQLADVSVVVPSDEYGPVEDVHLAFNHLATSYLRGLSTRISAK